MQFKRLRLAGFKSFVDPTELWIEPGLTGVVGPNGCGKSNLLEALRWVMGESRPKSLRSGGMEDVIFAGTDSRPKRNLADVSLLIDNSARTAPAQFNDSADLEVSRRIERDLGSLYRINGRDSRQKDVQLLFADAATGATSPALVSQGRVGALINAKPQDRRKLLEDAAGISGLHSRRKDAEQKLRGASTNLERLEDVLLGMDGQANALRRQAKQAVRYRTLSELIRQLEAQLLFAQWRAQSAVLDEARAALQAAQSAVTTASGEAAKLATRQADLASKLPALRDTEAQAAAALARLDVQAERLEEEKARISGLQEDLNRRLKDIQTDQQREADYARDAQDALKRVESDLERLAKTMAGDEETTQSLKDTLRAAQEAASAAEQALDGQSQDMARARAYQETTQGALRAAKATLERAQSEAERQTQIYKDLKAQAGEDDRLAAAQSALDSAERALEDAQAGLETAEKAQDTAATDLRAAQDIADEASGKLRQLESEISGVQAALDADRRSDGGTPLVDTLTIENGLELALGAALGDGLDLPLDEGTRHWQAAEPQPGDPSLPTGAEPLSQYVSGTDHISRRLTQTGVASDAAAAAEQAKQLKPGQQIVTRDGALWRWDGLRAAADAPSRASLRLRQRNHLKSLESQRSERETEAQKASAQAQKASTQRDEARAAREEARKTLQSATRAANDARTQVRQVETATRAIAEKLSASAAILETKQAAIETAKSEAKAAIDAVDALPDLSANEDAIAAQRRTVEAKRSALAEARAAYDSQVASAAGRKRAHERSLAERKQWQERMARASGQNETLIKRRTEITQALTELAARPDEIAQKQAGLYEALETQRGKRQAAADALALQENALREAETALTRAQENASQTREKRARCEAEAQAAQDRRDGVIEQCQTQFQRSPSQLLELCGTVDEAEIETPDILSAAIERRKLERERLGAVNLRADIELEELESEAAALRAEKEELETAIARLRGAIGSLNREGRARLMKAFDEVNDHFGRLFTTLFGGGSAYITLIESDDPLEAGLEIMASPPGKKLQSLSLLSGGEQALTALSLIFAVFMTNPSPICVLDEVDAPLDDANVERFCTLLDEMVSLTNTRFLIVTHNALTMSRMHRLFGVTMAERGVSQLVSVDLQQAETMVAAE
jgi:chromosome segregation protein